LRLTAENLTHSCGKNPYSCLSDPPKRANNTRIKYLLYQSFWALLDWLYPPACCCCGKPYARICRSCLAEIQPLQEPICDICGLKLAAAGTCLQCRSASRSYRALRSYARYKGVLRKALHHLKYGNDIALGEILARPLGSMLETLCWEIDFIVPVPAGIAHRKNRGYNQSGLLALPVALQIGKPYRTDILFKTGSNRTQVGLSYTERWQNVHAVFSADPRKVANRKVLVLDDIRTSGATMEACAKVLMENGASQVFGLTLAQAFVD